MNIKETLQLAWNNRVQITDALYNKYIEIKPEIEAEALRRKAICESNTCGYYDKDGKPETSVVPGKPACSICHCNIDLKVNCRICWCALKDIQQQPLWDAMMTKEQDDHIQGKEYMKQFEQNKP